MENTTHDTPRPIGYWLRAADRLISREFAAAFESEGVTRREWMILNVLDGSVESAELDARIQRGGKRLRALAERGWVAETDGRWELTDEGRAAKARLGEVVDGIRAKVSGAVTDEDFATTVASLEAIARGLGWDENERLPRGLRGFGPGMGRRGFGRPGFGPFRHGFGPGFGPAFGPGDEPDGHHRFGPRGFATPGHPGCDDHRGHGHHRHGERHAQRAYERGFDAGFSRGRDERSA